MRRLKGGYVDSRTVGSGARAHSRFFVGVFDDFSPLIFPAPLLYRAKSLKCERPSAVLKERKGQQTCHIVNRFREELCATDHTGLPYIATSRVAKYINLVT